MFCRLSEVDNKLREWMVKKDSSPRDTPISLPVESPKVSPRLQQKQTDITKRQDEEANDCGCGKGTTGGHRRQLSDSVTFQKRLNGEDIFKDEENNPWRERGGSDGRLSAPFTDNKLSFQENSSSRSSLGSRSHINDSREGMEGEEEGGELVSAMKESMTSEEVMSVVGAAYSEDILVKMRGLNINNSLSVHRDRE